MSIQIPTSGIRFLRQLKTHNDRDWFNERKAAFERDVREPWLAVLDAVNVGLSEFAPDYVTPPQKAALRIYRDIRFSKSKLPYKTHMAAWWSTTTQVRTSGGGFYVQVSADEVLVAAGVYQPQPAQLLAIRRYLQTHHGELRELLADRQRRKLLPEFDSHPLSRAPKGFLPDDPAAELLMCRQWALFARLPGNLASSPSLVREVTQRFRSAAPVVALLNAPLLRASAPRKSLF